MIGLQLALRADRLTALAMTGYPPVEGPYLQTLRLCQLSADAHGPDAPMIRQFVAYYERLRTFDDRAANRRLTIPRPCFAGADVVSVDATGENDLRTGETVARTGPQLVPLLGGWLDRHLR